jgi:RimJ/RimL family protein N-acetyltransferase
MAITATDDLVSPSAGFGERIRHLGTRIAGRLKLGLKYDVTRYGLRRDLEVPFAAPKAKIAITVRPLRADDLPKLLRVTPETSPEDRMEITWRRAFAERHMKGGYVAVDARDGSPCYVQWLFGAEDNEFVAGLGGFPRLAPDEALLENAYTPASHRGLGIMPAAMSLIAEQATSLGARYVTTFVEVGNIPSLKGCQRCGFAPDILHNMTRFAFGQFRRDTYERLPDGDPRRTPTY